MTPKDRLPKPLLKAFWLWPELGFNHLHNQFARFRKVVDIDSVPKSALAWITVDQCYRLSVNSKLVCRGPARGYQHSWSYDAVDIAPYLRKGRNLIAVRAYNAGHSTFGYRSEGIAGFLFAARIGRQSIVSDASWRCIRESNTRRDTFPYSLQLPGHQECIDLRTADFAWETLGFDDSDWKSSEQFRPWNTPPYMTLEPRGIPLMREFMLKPKVIGMGEGNSLKGWAQAQDLAGLRASEALEHDPLNETGKSTFDVAPTPKGKFRSILLDFGRVVVGSPCISVLNATGGESIDLLHTEVIDPARLAPKIQTTDHSRVRLANRLICRKGGQSHAFFHHLGFRYLTVTIRENARPLKISVKLDACGYRLEGSGAFRSSDPQLNRIWQACAHTQRICSLDTYVDTPWREQTQWWGDARIQAWNTYYLNADPRLLRRGIRILAGQSTPDGLTYGHAPTIAHHCILPDFSLVWILTLWDDYWQTGETAMLEQHRERVVSILEYFRSHTDAATGLIRHAGRYWLFLDWTDIQKEGQPALLSLWLLYTLQRLTELLRATAAMADDFAGIPAWAAALEASISKHLLGRDGLVCDGLSVRGHPAKKKSLQAQTLAWMCNLPGLDRSKALKDILLPWLRDDQVSHAAPSSYWCAYPLDLLAREGYGADVVAFIRRHWQVMGKFGSCFENFDPQPDQGDMLSHSHAWTAHPLYLLMRIIGGVRQTAPGWKTIRVDPVFVGDAAEITLPTPRGDISVRWAKSPEQTPKLKVSVPKAIKVDLMN
jgi:hypothetical protein